MSNTIQLKQKVTTGTALENLVDREMLVNNADLEVFIRVAGVLKQFLFDEDLKGGALSLKDRLSTISNFASPNAGGYISNYHYDNNPHASVATLVGVADRMDLAPYYTSQVITINRIGCSVTAARAGAFFKIVIYATGVDGFPDALLYETGNISAETTGYNFEVIDFTFQSGVCYWLGVRHSSVPTLRTVSLNSAYNLGIGSNGTSASQCTVLRRTLAFATPAPTNWSFVNADLTSNVTPPSIRFRIA